MSEAEIRLLCVRSRELFMQQPMLLELEAPIKICGDIHGQYYDLLRLFEYGGFPPESNYVFLGDYVDRGKQSLETICLLLAFKIRYPENFFILRGNHECASINRIYGFYDECKRRHNIKLWKTFTDCFNCLPCAAIVDEKIFCMHGGLSPDLHSLDQIKRVMRPTDVPDTGLLCDLLWCVETETAAWRRRGRCCARVLLLLLLLLLRLRLSPRCFAGSTTRDSSSNSQLTHLPPPPSPLPGRTRTRTLLGGARTTAASRSRSARTSSPPSCAGTTSTSSAARTRSSRTGTSSSRGGSW